MIVIYIQIKGQPLKSLAPFFFLCGCHTASRSEDLISWVITLAIKGINWDKHELKSNKATCFHLFIPPDILAISVCAVMAILSQVHSTFWTMSQCKLCGRMSIGRGLCLSSCSQKEQRFHTPYKCMQMKLCHKQIADKSPAHYTDK